MLSVAREDQKDELVRALFHERLRQEKEALMELFRSIDSDGNWLGFPDRTVRARAI